MSEPRIYVLDPSLTEEQVAVTFAMTSRSPEAFDQIAQQVSETKAADFHEKWVIGYGHASVAEHAILHVAFENISRIAADAIEENRLASYTEKSSRFQIINKRDYHIPAELHNHPKLSDYTITMNELFDIYTDAADSLLEALAVATPAVGGGGTPRVSPAAVRRLVMDQVRALLPAAVLTNVGMTANARNMAHTVSKLLSDPLEECRVVGQRAKDASLQQVPTLLKYAERTDALERQMRKRDNPILSHGFVMPPSSAALYSWSHENVAIHDLAMGLGVTPEIEDITEAVGQLGEYDPLPRAFEVVNYLFEVTMDYGALREFRRHRMMTPISWWLRPESCVIPELFDEYGMTNTFTHAMELSESLHHDLEQEFGPAVAQYAVTHAHQQNITVQMNLREFAEIIRLRTSDRAHASIREPVSAMRDVVRDVHPRLMKLIEREIDA